MFTIKYVKENEENLYLASEVSYSNTAEAGEDPVYEVSIFDAEGSLVNIFFDGTVSVFNDIGLVVAEYELPEDPIFDDDDDDVEIDLDDEDEDEDDEDEAKVQ
jgi:hypothetical protein